MRVIVLKGYFFFLELLVVNDEHPFHYKATVKVGRRDITGEILAGLLI